MSSTTSISSVTNPESLIAEPNYMFTETQDWFSGHVTVWKSIFPLLDSKRPRVLEIGVWEGRSSVFLLNELCKEDGELTCIDHFDLMRTEAGHERHAKVLHNLQLTKKSYRILQDFSVPALMKLLSEEMKSSNPGFDWIYIDGSHEADDTFLDGELCWRLARKGAIVIFDDYRWNKEPTSSIHHPKRGIDAFMELHRDEYERLADDNCYQMILKKTSEMRIGFLTAPLKSEKVKSTTDISEVFDYGINVAFTVDSLYSMAAAVAIRSLIETTPGRITLYVLDIGLQELEKQRINESIPNRVDVTINYLALSINSISTKTGMGKMWSKLDLLSILPVERVLYLDADIIVRKDLRDIWIEDLNDKPIAAALDVGMPKGHAGPHMSGFPAPYFNAGVLLVDLSKTRERIAELLFLSVKMRNSKFKDQDALNVHFANNWKVLSLHWNAQGLGTYASTSRTEHHHLNLSEMSDPAIIHFTGPVHPPLIDILNPYIQPFTSKPWGYAGAPGHPYANEWWNVLRNTSWIDWIDSIERGVCYKKEREIAKTKAIHDFDIAINKDYN